MREFYRSYLREFGLSLVFGVVAVGALVAVLSMFSTSERQETMQFAQNEVQFTAPVTEDTPGPVRTDSATPDREIAKDSPLPDRDR
jgi:hypothetical protein